MYPRCCSCRSYRLQQRLRWEVHHGEEVRFLQQSTASYSKILLYHSPGDRNMKEPGSSVSIVSDYGLDDRAIEVRSPTEAEKFFL
jgi:hypothetical protein